MDPLAYIGQFIIGASIAVASVSDIFGFKLIVEMLKKREIPFSRFLAAGAIALKIITGILIAVDCYAPEAAFVLASFIIIANFIFHDFWRYKGAEFMREYMAFLCHVAIIGGLIMIAGR